MGDNIKSKMVKQERAITLIALVVTIVVLIILATISIYTVLGKNGIITKSQEMKESYNNRISVEEESINALQEEYNNTMVGPPAGTVLATKPSTWTSTQVTPIADGNGGTVPLPDGFYYVGGDYDTGLVISDKPGDTLDASGTSMGNQFVWIPVANEAVLTRTRFDTTTGQPIAGLNTDYTEPYTAGYATEKSEYNTMRTQVLKYGGFYIGRFEAGINSEKLRKTYSTAQTVVVKRGVAPYNYVPWGKDVSDASEKEGQSGAVYLAKKFATQEGYTSVTSTLCYGSQWDAMCRYIGDSQRTTPTKSAPGLTGSVNTDVSKNIYDLAGNCREWTMEAFLTSIRVLRGGLYSKADPVSYRGNSSPSSYYNDYSFRCTLYISEPGSSVPDVGEPEGQIPR